MKYSIYILFLVVSVFQLQGQGTIRGKVTDSNGEELIGATILIKENPTKGTITDFDGNYSIEVDRPSVTLVVQYISYITVQETVQVVNGQTVIRNYELTHSTTEIEDVVITAKADRANHTYMQKIKLKSAISMDYISKETISQIGDSQVDDAVKRVTGVSSIGGFISVRGLADRYVLTTINGTRIPTLDPLTNNIKLDLFPTALIDNIIITKTLSPELPGNWAGAYLSIETKDYPDKLEVSVKSSFGYNTTSTFRNIISSQRSKTDWLGYDNSLRDIQHFEQESFPFYNNQPRAYDEFLALGLQPFLNSLGLSPTHLSNTSGNYLNNIYYRLGLIELGYLAPGLIYNNEAVEEAYLEYRFTDQQDAFQILNQGTEDFGTTFKNTWLTERIVAPINYSQDISIGHQIKLFGRPFGIVAGLRYSKSIKNDPESKIYSYGFQKATSTFMSFTDYTRENTIETNGWSALINTSYKPSLNHSISLTFMPNMIGINNARSDSGYSSQAMQSNDFPFVVKYDQRYEERQQLVYQARSTHYFEFAKLKVDMVASYTDGASSSPDYRKISYGGTSTPGIYETSPVFHPAREFRYLDEDILDTKIIGELPLNEKPGLARTIRFGGSYFWNSRKTEQYLYYVDGVEGFSQVNDIDNFLSLDNFRFNQDESGIKYIPYYYYYNYSDVDFTLGFATIISAFGMIDYSLNPIVRVAGGLRYEEGTIFSDIQKYYEAGYPAGDERRLYPLNSGPVFGLQGKTADPADIKNKDYLPSANIILKIRETQDNLINLRLNYSKSLARPSIREVSPFWAYDYEQNNFLIGNPNLQQTRVHNFDFRFESFSNTGNNISVSLFYKDFKNHIELSNEQSITWRNGDQGTAFGMEIEGRKTIIKNLFLGANITYVYSNANIQLFDAFGNPRSSRSRQMYGQAPYIINALLTYTNAKFGLMATASYNVQGPKLALSSASTVIPDIYEMPRNLIDLKISKSVGKHFIVDLKIRNLLDAATTRAHDGDGENIHSWSEDTAWENMKYHIYDLVSSGKRYEWDYIYDSYNYGTNIVIGIAYKL